MYLYILDHAVKQVEQTVAKIIFPVQLKEHITRNHTKPSKFSSLKKWDTNQIHFSNLGRFLLPLCQQASCFSLVFGPHKAYEDIVTSELHNYSL